MAVRARSSGIGRTMGTRGTKRFMSASEPTAAPPPAPAPAPAPVAAAPKPAAVAKPKAPPKPKGLTVTNKGSSKIMSTSSGKIVAVVVDGKKKAGGPVGKYLPGKTPPKPVVKKPVARKTTTNRSTPM